jgi:photosystem II CP47 chlorophyll apoprotein
MHTGMLASWSGLIVLYELITFDPTDPAYNPCLQQGSYVIPFISRIGAISSLYSWSLGIKLNYSIWTYETIALSHLDLSVALILASFWHWAYSDLNVFAHSSTRLLVLDLNKILGIHFILASVLCFGFGYHHLSGFIGPGMWTSDSKGLEGCIRFVKPIYSLISTSPKCYALIPSHHIASGFSGILMALWHIQSNLNLYYISLM